MAARNVAQGLWPSQLGTTHARAHARSGPRSSAVAPLRALGQQPGTPTNVRLRLAQREDVPAVFSLLRELAEYENLVHELTGSAEALEDHMFGKRPFIEALLVEVDSIAVGFGRCSIINVYKFFVPGVMPTSLVY